MHATLFRCALIAAALTAATGCGDAAEEDNNTFNNGGTTNTDPNNTANNTTTPRPDLVEAAGCMPDYVRSSPTNPSQAEIAYMTATESALQADRLEFGAFCGSAIPVEIDWNAMFSSTGFDDEEEVGSPGAVAAATTPFLTAAPTWCNGHTPAFYEQVSRVIITATDTDDRIGLCWDEASTTIIYRAKLDPDALTATTPAEPDITAWLDANLE